MKSIRAIVFFIISQDYFQLTPLWKPQILLRQLYSFFITFKFATLRSKPFDLLVLAYLFTSFLLSFLQLYNYAIITGKFPFIDLLKAQYPLFMAFSILIIYSRKGEVLPDLFLKSVKVLVWLNILLNVLVAVLGLEETIADSYDLFEFSFNQNIVVFFIFIQAIEIYHESDNQKKFKLIGLLLALLLLINIPNFQRARFLVIVLILFFVFFKNASLKFKLTLPVLGALFSFFIFKTEKFATIFDAFISKEDAIDPSLAGRFIQIQQILSAEFNPIFGFGFLNTNTKDILIGETYFHPNDTGLFGVYFNGGYLGLLMFFVLLVIAIREIIKFRKSKSSFTNLDSSRLIIKKAAVLMTCFIIINGLFSGSIFYDPMFLVSYIFLIKCF